MLADRTGSRTRVLRYLLELAGADAQIAFVRAFGAPEPSELPDGDLYGSAVIRVTRPGGEPLWISGESRGAPFGYLPAPLRGQEGVVLAAGLPHVRLPAQPIETDLVEATVEIDPHPDGSAEITIVERRLGGIAAGFREELENIPAAELEETFAGGYTSRVVPGSELVSLAIEGKDDPEAPLVFRYRLTARRLGRMQGGRLVLPPFFEQGLAQAYASLPARTTTELVAGGAHRLVLRVRGASAATGPDVELRGPAGATYERTSRRERGTLVVERRVSLPRILVEPADYPAFAAWARSTEDADRAEVSVATR